jgi:hypothetical protein
MILAHALGRPFELPLPLSVFLWGASVVLLFSFFALGRLWRTSRFEAQPSTSLPAPVQKVARVARIAGRAVMLLALALVFWSGVAGRNVVDANIAPRSVYVVFWVGFTVASALFGDFWRAISPFDTMCAIGQWARDRLGRPARPPHAYPSHWGHWPAAVGLFGFVWLELVHPDPADPRNVALAIEVYTAAMLAGANFWGRAWLRQGDAFGVYFGLLARLSPFFQDSEGTLRVRPPLSGLAGLEPHPGTAAVIFVALGSTSFDGLSRTRLWAGLVAGKSGSALLLILTLGLAWTIATVVVLYAGAMRAAAGITGEDAHHLGSWFLPSLVPIVFAYALAHYFTLGIFEGQTTVVLASDPLGHGANYFGTFGWAPDVTFVTLRQIAWVQAGSIVFGHIAGVVLAHDRAVERLGRDVATRSQYPLLVAMVAYTVGGLALLFGR